MTDWVKESVVADPFPFHVGPVRLAYPGTLNGAPTEHDPRPEFEATIWNHTNDKES